tara:strand:- start:342 stop:1037 length:696 start_codon:yes stop_codon:yes gene_type:complete
MNGFLHLALNASFLVQLVMVVLVALSVWSWTIIFVKNKFLQGELNKTIKFDKRFWSGIDLAKYYSQVKDKRKKSSIEDIFCIGWVKYINLHGEKKLITPETISQTSFRAMQVGIGKEQEFLESDLQTLATIASVSPYIGLLGTVWGIMNSFQSLSHTSQTSIALVAPGISEALIATALGLIAAIPAVIAYNKFNGDIYKIVSRYENFSEQLTELLQVKHIPLEETENNSSK